MTSSGKLPRAFWVCMCIWDQPVECSQRCSLSSMKLRKSCIGSTYCVRGIHFTLLEIQIPGMFLKKPSGLENTKEIWAKSSITETFGPYEIPLHSPHPKKLSKFWRGWPSLCKHILLCITSILRWQVAEFSLGTSAGESVKERPLSVSQNVMLCLVFVNTLRYLERRGVGVLLAEFPYPY